MEHKYEEGEIVMYKKDNSIYKIVEVVQANIVKSGITMESYTISNDHKKVHLVLAKDLETL
jgi:hypothetical protein